ncbi:hypothetical protein [Alicyclobacillus sp. SO9]|uniref:hypothetical protein n=1 Tax=Alicyclobacillus sp. SO9 TaxID=2665646 RepID=UPI0018E704A1|nr:hypothetical protein [Alicyclobacillus sp. SO9]QQE78881.1 hypothetical protein GI364_24120 [Alicyclobacillus sp. SO9]
MDPNTQRSMYAKYGGVHFVNLVPQRDINEFVRALPEQKRDSIFEVMTELDKEGLIKIQNDGQWTDPEGEIH